MEHWAFTIKYVKHESMSMTDDHITEKYEEILSSWNSRKNVKVIYRNYERDKQNRLHIHGIIESTRRLYFKPLMKHGFTMKFELIYDEAGWKKYITKEEKPNPKCLFKRGSNPV